MVEIRIVAPVTAHDRLVAFHATCRRERTNLKRLAEQWGYSTNHVDAVLRGDRVGAVALLELIAQFLGAPIALAFSEEQLQRARTRQRVTDKARRQAANGANSSSVMVRT